MEGTDKLTWHDVLGYVIAYALWLVTAALGFLALLQTRSMINIVWPILGGSRWVLRAVDRFALLALGIIWVLYAILAEDRFRSSVTLSRQRRFKASMPVVAEQQARQERQTKSMSVLDRLGLSLLVRRCTLAAAAPAMILIVTYLIEQIVLQALQQ